MSRSQDDSVSDTVSHILYLFKQYEYFKYSKYLEYHINGKTLHGILKDFVERKVLQIELLGYSVENRPIYVYTYGTGSIGVLCWTQMHGDEPTASLALLDVIQYLANYDQPSGFIREGIKLHMIPVLNPDGAENYCRRNALQIDLNRDARHPVSPEALILKDYANRLPFDFALNLHDQEIYYSAGEGGKATVFSLLAPMPCEDMTKASQVNNFVMAKALVTQLWRECESLYPNQIARYNDEFEPRAFGEFFQNQGICTILMEAGGSFNDVDKRDVRKLYCLSMLRALWHMANRELDISAMHTYPRIPLNLKMAFFDLIIRNAQIERSGKIINTDIGIRRYRKLDEVTGSLYFTAMIEDIGDLSVYHAYEEIDATGLFSRPGTTYAKAISSKKKLSKMPIHEFLVEGILFIQLKDPGNIPFTHIPINFIKTENTSYSAIKIGCDANFVLGKPGKPASYAIINGFSYNLMTSIGLVKNAKVYF
jgi:hypothetical protein